jgi:subtilisin family serine protease
VVVVTWLFGEVLLELGTQLRWVRVLAAVLVAVLTALPAVLLGWLSKVDWARAAGQGWTFAAVAGGGLGLARAVPVAFHELYLALLALLALGGAAVLRRRSYGNVPPWVVLLALAAGLAFLTPWLWTGALGGVFESLLAVASALAFGLLASKVLTPLVYVASGIRNRWGRAVLGGLVSGVGLTSLAAGIGQWGVQVAALVALPAVAFTAAALATGSGQITLTPLVGVAAMGPLAFVDPEETSLILGLHDGGFWTLVAAVATLALAVPVFAGYVETVGRGLRPSRGVAAGVATAMAGVAAVVYAVPGQPGWHGQHVFVVLKTQADLSGLDAITNRDERLRETYRRLVDTAQRTQAPLRRELRRLRLGFTPYYLVNGIDVDAGPVARPWLSRLSDVDRVLFDPQLRPLPDGPEVMHGTDPAPASPQWNLTVIGADRVWRDLGVTGKGILVGTSDSGVDGNHPALRGKYRGGEDSWLDPWGTKVPTDHNGHGTHTLGTAIGDKVGVAPGATWIGCVNLPRNLGNPASYLTCLQFMLAPYPRGGNPFRDGRTERAPQVLTNSWGCPDIEGCDRGALRQATAAFTAAGIFFVVAAGNTGPYCGSVTDPPAIYPDALTVGAIDDENKVARFSSRGPAAPGLGKPDIVAPGVQILSALPGGGYGKLDGTSMAAPHVAGVVALMWSANPKLVGDIAGTTRILRETAQPVAPSDPATSTCGTVTNVVGAGRVDALAAVKAAQAVQGG